jgi:hypothetical protein
MIPTQIVYKNFNLVMLIAFLPSLHYWTTLLGKEPFILLGITTFVLEISKAKGNLFQIIGALLLVALVRPHIAILLILCFVTIYILFKKNTLKTKILVIFSSLLIFILSGVAFLKLSKIHKLDVAKTLRYNEFSKLSKSDSNSYVPMNEYSLPEQVFTFYFRPLFLDSKSVLFFCKHRKFNGKLPLELKRFEIESVKQKLYEKFKIYGVTNRCDFKTSRCWHVGQRDLSSTRHQPADIF